MVPSLSKHPDDRLAIQPVWCYCITCPRQAAFELMFAWMRKGYGNSDGVSFWLGLNFLRPAQFLAKLVHPDEKNQFRPSTTRATLWIILQTFPFNCVATVVIFFAWRYNWNVSFMLACLGTPDLITVLVLSVSWRTVYYENAIPSLSPINLLTYLLSPCETKLQPPELKYEALYNSDICSNFRISSPTAQCKAPLEDFLVTVLLLHQAFY